MRKVVGEGKKVVGERRKEGAWKGGKGGKGLSGEIETGVQNITINMKSYPSFRLALYTCP